MRFTEPLYLLLLVPIIAGLVFSFRHVHGMMRFRKRLAFVLRFLLASLLVLALAGPEAHRPNHGLCTIFVLDRSDSISESDYAKARAFIGESLKHLDREDLAGLVVFGKDAMIDRTPGLWREMGQIQSAVEASASDLGAAIRLAGASFPEGKSRRIVVLSDGNETLGDATGAAMAASADGITIDHVTLGQTPREGEVTVVDTVMPSEVRIDQPFDVRVVVDATKESKGILVLDLDGVIVKKQPVKLNPGRNALVISQVLASTGFHRYRATIVVDGDHDNRNNIGVGFVAVRGRPKVLVLQNSAKAGPLSLALASQGITVDTFGPEGVPARPEQLQNYDAVIFNDINASMMTPFQMKLVQGAVKESGIGFAMIGGEDSFLPGGYFGSPIADVLPVDMNIRQRKSFPSTSVLIICDTSGSMGMVEDGLPKVKLAAKAAEQTILLMAPIDRGGVVGSTDAIEFVAPMQKLDDKPKVIEQIRKLTSGGGGIYIRPSLELAEKALGAEKSKVRHLILMADGSDCDEREGSEDIVARMRAAKITVSIVSIGDGQFVPFLKNLAKIGDGRFYLAAKASQLQAIFTQDAAVMSRSAIQEGAFLPKVSLAEEALKGIAPETIPPLLAYCLTDSRPLANVGMRTNLDDPLLASWQYGLGTALAFTSDAQARWAQKWVTWDQFSTFWAQAVRTITRRATRNAYEVATKQEGGKGVVEIKAFDTSDKPLEQFSAQVNVLMPSGAAQKVTVTQKAPGVYQGEFDANEMGSYVVSVAEDDASGAKRVDTSGLAIPYPPEYRSFRANEPLMERISKLSGGQVLTDPKQAARPVKNPGHSVQELWMLCVLLAALLLPIDIGARRIALPIGEMIQKVRAWMKDRKAKAEAPSAQTLVVDRLHKAKRTTVASSAPVDPIQIDRARDDKPEDTPMAASSSGSAASRLLEAKRKKQD